MKRLILHLGLPKTATTALQNRFFPQVKGFIGKSDSKLDSGFDEVNREIVKSIGYFASQEHAQPRALDRLVARLPFDTFSTILISNEAFSRWTVGRGPRATWTPVQKPRRGEMARKSPHPVVPFLEALGQLLGSDTELLTIITLRAQVTYLPSQAAEKGADSMDPIVRRIVGRNDEFILWDRLVRNLEELRGKAKHLTLLYEDGVETNAREIVKFASLEPLQGNFDFEAIPFENVRGDGTSWKRAAPVRRPDRLALNLTKFLRVLGVRPVPRVSKIYVLSRSWLLSGWTGLRKIGRKPLALTDKQKKKIDLYVRESNASLSQTLRRDLRSLGY